MIQKNIFFVVLIYIFAVTELSAHKNFIKKDIMETNTGYDTATFGGGCFWCIEAIFDELKGVKEAISGFAGGTVKNPSYEQVCTGTTGHAEVCQVIFDPEIISYNDLLLIFFSAHDPTTLNRQGADTGTQYRSVIFYHDARQKMLAENMIKTLTEQKVYENPVVTELVPYTAFYSAEKYHQQYFENNPNQAYCRIVINPKLGKFRKNFSKYLK